MDTQMILVAAVAVILLGIVVWLIVNRMRSRRLKARFGPEYDRAVGRLHSREVAERELRERERRVQELNIVALSPDECRRYQSIWTSVQARFVDDPKGAVDEANHLIQEVMERRGYPVSDFEQSAADLSVAHPVVVENYRAAYQIAERNESGIADTEELRQAFVYYRVLFQELLGSNGVERRPEAPEQSDDNGYRVWRERRRSNKSKRGGLQA